MGLVVGLGGGCGAGGGRCGAGGCYGGQGRGAEPQGGAVGSDLSRPSPPFGRVGVACWSSGTGGAGLGGALGYGALLQAGLPLPRALLPAFALPLLTLLR